MPKYSRRIDISGKSSSEIYLVVSETVEKFLSKSPVGNFEVKRDESEKIVKIESSMATATLYCIEQGIEVEAKLSLIAAPFRSKLDEGIDKWLQKAFPS